MSSSFRGRGRGRGGANSMAPPSARDANNANSSSLDDATKQLKQRYNKQLTQARELFPDWSDEDLLNALQEANGDVELAILRISEGHAQQWGSVSKKKAPKPQAAAATNTATSTSVISSAPTRGGFAGRGRGGFEGGRGGRGGARGGRGGRGGAAGATNGTPRPAYTNGAASSATPASFVEQQQQQATAAPSWGNNAPTGAWAPKKAEPAAPAAEATPAAQGWESSEAAPAPASSADQGWTDSAAEDSKAKTTSDEATSAAAAPTENGWDAPAAEPKPKPASKTIQPGSTRSWASIARPPSPPKPAPAPKAPEPVSAPAQEAAPAQAEAAAPAQETAPESAAAAPVINLPASMNATSAPAEQDKPAAAAPGWASNNAPSDPWAAAAAPAPLAPGEGWADVVAATKDTEAPFAQQAAAEAKAHLPPNDINAAGPIEVSTNNASQPTAAAPAEQQQPQQQVAQDKPIGAGPPGFPAKRDTAPATGGDRPVDVQFGSLSLYDSQSSYKQEAPAAQEAQRAPEQSGFSQQPQHQQYDQSQSAFGQAPANLFPQSNAFSRYPNTTTSPYAQFQQQQQVPQVQQQQQQQQPQQQAEDNSAASAYNSFKPESVSSPYFQHPGAASHSPAPGQPPQAPLHSTYGGFAAAPQQAPGQPGPFGSTQSDYSALYGQDALRNMGFYDQYGQNSAFQAPSTASRSEDPTSSASHTPAPANSQTPAVQQQQAQQQQMPGQQHPYMMHYGYPQGYGYYGGYGQGYQQVPPNFQALQQQYNASPYYQQQQYGSRNFAPQAAQPGQVGQGAYRQQQQQQQQQAVGGQGYGAQANAQTQAYAQYGQQQARDTRDQKDLDRSSFGAFY